MNSAELRDRLRRLEGATQAFADDFDLLGTHQVYGRVTSGEIQAICREAAAALERLEALETALRDPCAQSDVKWVPGGWRALDAYTNGAAVVICGAPEFDDETHNCDEMGCGSVGPHVLHFVALSTPAPAGQQGDDR